MVGTYLHLGLLSSSVMMLLRLFPSTSGSDVVPWTTVSASVKESPAL